MATRQKAQSSNAGPGKSVKTDNNPDTTDVKLISAAAIALLRVSGVAENLFTEETQH